MKKTVIPAILAATVLIAGFVAFLPVQRAQTVHTFLANLINENTNTQVGSVLTELQDKLKLIVQEDDVPAVVPEGALGTWTIRASAGGTEGSPVPFNLKEVYVCGESNSELGNPINITELDIENGDITIRQSNEESFEGAVLVDAGNFSCADVISVILDNSGRAGAMGLGSEEDVVIRLVLNEGGAEGSSIDRVKCVAFVPNSVSTFTCDLSVILS